MTEPRVGPEGREGGREIENTILGRDVYSAISYGLWPVMCVSGCMTKCNCFEDGQREV